MFQMGEIWDGLSLGENKACLHRNMKSKIEKERGMILVEALEAATRIAKTETQRSCMAVPDPFVRGYDVPFSNPIYFTS